MSEQRPADESKSPFTNAHVRIILGIAVSILVVIVVTVGLETFKPPDDGKNGQYLTIQGEIGGYVFRPGNVSTPSDDLTELDILVGPINERASHHFVFLYGIDGFNATYLFDEFYSGRLKSPTVKLEVDFTPEDDDILLIISDPNYWPPHTRDNTYRGIEIDY
ncbi:MAG: hypothetical protein ACXAEN_26355 [Candidatus Thorarchaeota archaeon]|jgi:hypothetical protein